MVALRIAFVLIAAVAAPAQCGTTIDFDDGNSGGVIGAFYAPLTLIRYKDFAWTRGKPAVFQSSPDVERGFCAACGTPLTFAHRGSQHLDIAIGSLDEPQRVKPETQIGIESRMPWAAELAGLPEKRTDDFMPAERLARIVSHQHPDHDTEVWPVKK